MKRVFGLFTIGDAKNSAKRKPTACRARANSHRRTAPRKPHPPVECFDIDADDLDGIADADPRFFTREFSSVRRTA